MLSKSSIDSEWVKSEVRTAVQREREERKRVLFPIRLVEFDVIQSKDWFDGKLGIDLAEEICKYYIPDFRK